MGRKVTTESWLNDLLEKFPDNTEKFGYEKVVYHKAKEKVEIYCKTCGKYFWQTPCDHMSGKGCAKCAGNMKQTKDQFLNKLFERYPDKRMLLDFSDFEYIDSQTKSKVTCLRCGDVYFVTPNGLYSGKGCKKCHYIEQIKRQSSTTEEFIKKATKLFEGYYGYQKTTYVNNHTPVIITCPVHGDFLQSPGAHLQKHGCAKCKKVAKHTSQSFQEQANLVHEGFYQYPDDYRGCFEPIRIVCPIHGDFLQTPSKHLSGQGCPRCSKTGFDPFKESWLYVMADDLNMPLRLKVGITNTLESRISELVTKTPFRCGLLSSYHFEAGHDTRSLERLTHTVFEHLNCGYTGFGGATEWFWYDPKILDFLEENC